MSNARNDATRPSSDDGTPNIKTQLTVIASANTGETLEGSAGRMLIHDQFSRLSFGKFHRRQQKPAHLRKARPGS